METVLGLTHLFPPLLLQVVCTDGAICTTRVDNMRLLNVREKANDVFLLIYMSTNKDTTRES